MKKIALCIMAIGFIAYTQAQDLSLGSPFGKFIQPATGCSLTNAENITIRIFNFGSTLTAGTSFNVSYSINGGAPVTEVVILPSNLLANSSLTYTFTSQANLSTPGNYSLTASVNLPGDINATNNSSGAGYVVTNYGSTPVGGSISGSTSACASGNNGTLTLSGFTGEIVRWEYSNDNGNTWYYISNITSTQNYLNLKTTTHYRAVIRNNCGVIFSATATITINC